MNVVEYTRRKKGRKEDYHVICPYLQQCSSNSCLRNEAYESSQALKTVQIGI